MLLSEDVCPWDINVDTTDVYFYDKLVENTWNPIGNGWRLEPEGGTLSIECYDASLFSPWPVIQIPYFMLNFHHRVYHVYHGTFIRW